MKSSRHIVAFVHHALADIGAKSAFLNDAQNFFSVAHGLHRERARRTTFDQFSDAKLRRGADRFRSVRCLHRPYAFFQPIDEREIIGRATKQRLTKMDVRLYKSWQHGAAMRFDPFGSSVVNLTANFGDPSVADQ